MKEKSAPDTIFGQFQPPDGGPHHSRSIGELIRDARSLTDEDVDRITDYQREHGVRFGEAAIALGLANTEDVLRALSQQFKYAYVNDERRELSAELVTLNQPFGHQAEAYRAVRSQILMRAKPAEVSGNRSNIYAIVSPSPGDGKTFFAANLAVILTQLGGKVLVIDADLRSGRMHEVFGVDNGSGLSHILSGRGGKGVVKAVSGVNNLFVLPVGIQPPNPLELVEGAAFGLLLREVAVKFDYVVVDTPAASLGTDGVVVASRCRTALIVARRNATKVSDLRELVEWLNAGQAMVAGVVMNEN